MSNIGKQTKKTGSKFGGEWTVAKLEIIDKYLDFYIKAMDKQTWANKIYIDAFAGSGKTNLPDGAVVEGSPAIALKYDFEKYYFIEYDAKRIEELKIYISKSFPTKLSKVEFMQGDCNIELPKLFNAIAKNKNNRGVMFLDPYALELKWEILEKAKETCLDVWYLFPMMANRLLTKDKSKLDEYRQKLNTLLGGNEWEQELYFEDPQISMFGGVKYIKHPIEKLEKYVIERLKKLFGDGTRYKVFHNVKNSPLFMLCFFVTNPKPNAKNLGGKVVSDIFKKIDTLKLKGGEHEM